MKTFFTPLISNDTKGFWDGCKSHKLLFQKCDNCQKFRWPASIVCPNCSSMKFSYVEVAGSGTIISYVKFFRAFHSSIKENIPYVVAVIELNCGVTIISNIVDSDLDNVDCGKKVQIDWRSDKDKNEIPIFKLKDE